MSEPWRLLVDDGVEAAAGLAVDEALMSSYARPAVPRPPTVRLYTYASHAALVGRYQHLEAEVDLEACAQTGTAVNRRPTGGGAIIMGGDQLGVAVVGPAPREESPRQLLSRLSTGIVAGLARLGVTAEFGGKNDLVVGGRKIAGLGIYLDPDGAMLFHASVLVDLDVGFMLSVLRIPAAKLGDKGVAAVHERVTTVREEAGLPLDLDDVRDAVAAGFAEGAGGLRPGAPGAEERARAADLVERKYATTAWLHQRSPHPDANGSSVFKTPNGLVRLYLAMNGTTIKSALFTGDFNEVPDEVTAFEAALRWQRADPADPDRLARSAALPAAALGVEPATVATAVLDAARLATARGVAAPVRLDGSCYFPEAG